MHWANKYIGTPWVFGGDSIDTGFDCWGLFRFIQHEHYGLDLPSIPLNKYTYKAVAKEFSSNAEFLNWYEVDAGKQQDGDAVLMRIAKHPNHVGVWLNDDDGRVVGALHTLEGIGAVFSTVQALNQNGWKVKGYYRHISK